MAFTITNDGRIGTDNARKLIDADLLTVAQLQGPPFSLNILKEVAHRKLMPDLCDLCRREPFPNSSEDH